MQTEITLTGEHLRNERNNYSNWPFAFWRELFQNSIDEFCSVITINFTKKGEGLRPDGQPIEGILVRFKDNGGGMTAETLRNVYFRLGATTKKGSSKIGGHGKARMITCFSHHAYGINTLTNKVVGYGTSVKGEENAPHSDGCEIGVDVDTKGKWNEVDIVSHLRHFLSYAQLDCDIKSNLPEFNDYSDWLYKRRHVRDISCGGVYVNKSGLKSGEAVVRVNGVPMFVRSHRGKAQVVVELDFERSREILVSNRDSLDSKYETAFDDFLQEIAVDTTAALRDRHVREERFLGRANASNITYRQDKLKKEKVKKSEPVPQTYEEDQTEDGQVPDIFDELKEAARSSEENEVVPENGNNYSVHQTIDRVTSEDIRRLGFTPVPQVAAEEQFAESIPAFTLFCDTDDAAMKKAMWLFNPENKDGKYFGSTKKKLAILWAVAIEEAVQAWLDYTGKDYVSWMPGFLFSTDRRGQCTPNGTGTNYIYVRPVNLNGTIDFRLNKIEDRVRLLVIACHEVAHLSESYHNEEYVKILDAINQRVFARLSKIMKRMSKTMKANKRSFVHA